MFDRDCNSCVHHIQADPVNLFCMDCLMDPELPGWEPSVESYVAAIDERHMEQKDLYCGQEYAELQSRKESLLESILNTFSGWLISLVLWMFVIAPAFGIQSSLTESALINGIFTGVSIVRGYFWRRFFTNRYWRKANV